MSERGFHEDAVPPNFLNLDEPEAPAPPPPPKVEGKAPAIIPVLPKRKPISISNAETRGGVPAKAAAAANMKLRGASYANIAEVLEYENPAAAQADVLKVLAMTHSPEEWETMRVVAAARAEMLLEQSVAMASADFLVDEATGERIPNSERRLWHGAAQTDLMNWVAITGAKAPSKIEVTPGEVQLERLVAQMIERSGHSEVHEADVLELDQLPSAPDGGPDDLDVYG